MSNLFNFPESYSFKCNEETTLRIFRYPSGSKIEFNNVEFHYQSEDNSLDLADKKVILSIGERADNKKAKHCGTLTNYEEDVTIQVAYEKEEYHSLLNSLQNNPNLKSLLFGVDISQKEAKKKVDKSLTWYLIENFTLVNKLK